MNKIYKIIWNAVKRQWIVTSELASRGKNKSIKLITLATLTTISSYSMAAATCQINSDPIIVSGNGPACYIPSGTYEEVNNASHNVVTVDNQGNAIINGNITLKSKGQNHALQIGAPFGSPNHSNNGGQVKIEGSLNIVTNGEANSDTSRYEARPSGILMGGDAHLVVEKDLNIDHTDHAYDGSKVHLNTEFLPGAAIRIWNSTPNTSSIWVKGKTIIKSNGHGISNGHRDHDLLIYQAGILTFDDLVNINTTHDGIQNNAGKITFHKTALIESEKGMGIFQSTNGGTIHAREDLTLITHDLNNALNIDAGTVKIDGKATITTTGDGHNNWESSTAIYINGGEITFGRELTATTRNNYTDPSNPQTPSGTIITDTADHADSRQGDPGHYGTVIRVKKGTINLATNTELTANGVGNGIKINHRNGIINLNKNTKINTAQGNAILLIDGQLNATPNSETLIATTDGPGNVIRMDNGLINLTKQTELTANGAGNGILMNNGELNLNENTTITTKQGNAIFIKDGEIKANPNSNVLTATTTDSGHVIQMDGGTATLAQSTTLNATGRGHGILISGGQLNLNDLTEINSIQGDAIQMNGGSINQNNSADTLTATTTGTGNVITMHNGTLTVAKNTALNATDTGHGIDIYNGTINLSNQTAIKTKDGHGINFRGGQINTLTTLNASTEGSGNVINMLGGQFTTATNTQLQAQGNGTGITIHDGLLTLNTQTNITTQANHAIEFKGGTITNNGKITINSPSDRAQVYSSTSNGQISTFNNHGELKTHTAPAGMFSHGGNGTFNINNTGILSSVGGALLTNTADGTIEVNNSGSLTGLINAANGTINLTNSAIWENMGDSKLNNLTNKGSIVFKHNPAVTRGSNDFNKIEVKGDYIGRNNATLKMHTVWNHPGDIDGTNSYSDQFIIQGTASGQTTVIPVAADGTENKIDGNVQQLKTQINTIPVVKVGHSGTDRAFIGTAYTTGVAEVQLAKRTTAGADEYFWSITASNDDGDGGGGSTDEGKSGKNKGTLIYADAVAGYTVMPRVNLEQGFASLGTLRERRGNVTCFECFTSDNRHTWARAFGKHQKQDGKLRLNLDTDIYGVQIGHDFWAKQTANNGLNMLGAYLAYSHAATDFSDQYHARNGLIISDKKTGEGKSDSISLGLTNTYYGYNGSYLDLVGQLSYLHNKYTANTGKNPDSQDGWGAAVSAEVGRTLPLRQSNWSVTPQAQLVYQLVDLDSFHDGVRHVDQNNQDALRGRVGLRLEYNAAGQAGQAASFYTVGNIWHDFINPSHVSIGRDSIREKFNTTWGEIGVGLQLPLARHSQLYGDVRYEHNFGSSKHQSFRGNIGFKVNW